MKYLVLLLIVCFLEKISTEESPKVIIIGSGPSGIAAASRLLENGITDVIILEAENRYGGRVNTTKIGEFWADLGAQWVHGEEGNVANELASPLGLLSKSPYQGGPEELGPNFQYYESTGIKQSDERMKGLVEYIGKVEEESSNDLIIKPASFGEFFETKFDEYFKNHPEFTTDFQKSFMANLQLAMMGSETAEDWHKLSLEGTTSYSDCPGYNGVNWKDRAYGTILDILMKRYPNPEEELPVLNKTLLNKKVSKIRYGGDGAVTVTTKDGSDYIADHIIFTPSLGVLKADHEKIFDPPLSQRKKEAIEKLGFGRHAKIILYFDNPWWEHGKNFFNNFLWTKEDREEIEHDPERSWMLGIAYGLEVEYKPKLFLLWMTGNRAIDMERIPEEQFKNQTMWVLQKFMGKTHDITPPREIRRSMWNTNENFRGTYSYESLESFNSKRGHQELMKPIMRQEKPVLQFAGEATNPDRYATVHGAIETGWREADRLIEFYNKKNVWKMIDDLSS